MSRTVDEWIGKDDDAVPPPRVRLRVFDTAGGLCHLCSRKIPAGEYWQCDHVIALVNGADFPMFQKLKFSAACLLLAIVVVDLIYRVVT